MRVLFFSPAAELGGAERCLLDSIAALRQTEPKAALSLLSIAQGPLLAEARELGASVICHEPPREFTELGESGGFLSGRALLTHVSSTPALAGFLKRLRRTILDERADVLHSNGMKAHLLAGLLAPARPRLVIHLHDFVGARGASRRLLPILAHFRRRAVFVANSRAVAEDFQRLAPAAEVHQVYNVVDTDYFRPGAGDEEWLADAAGLAPPASNAVSFGLVATYATWKGHRLFIEAAGRLHAAHPHLPLRFYVVGGPIYKTLGSQVSVPELLASARAAGISECFGLVPFQVDIARVYRGLNVVVHASTKPEPFGRSIVEAMACARPVVVARAGGAAELFHDGENAVGFTPGSSPSLLEAMASLLDAQLRARLGPAARLHAVARFSRARLGPELLAVYRH